VARAPEKGEGDRGKGKNEVKAVQEQDGSKAREFGGSSDAKKSLNSTESIDRSEAFGGSGTKQFDGGPPGRFPALENGLSL
jgi:hypothetical protein